MELLGIPRNGGKEHGRGKDQNLNLPVLKTPFSVLLGLGVREGRWHDLSHFSRVTCHTASLRQTRLVAFNKNTANFNVC